MSTFNTPIDWATCSAERQAELLMRPAIAASDSITRTVSEILDNVKANGDRALRDYSARFDKAEVAALRVSAEQIAAACARLGDDIKQAMAVAVANVDTFHNAQRLPPVDVETQPGVRCQQVTRPIDSVGLYIPGGSAPLFSTVLMLATPARIAGCRRVVLCSPPPIADEILYAAQLCGVQEVFQVGGAQAIAALAFGTESVPRVAKIFGPGNAFVTEAKRQVSQRLDGAAIDMPAGPSEVLVIADAGATPAFVASDLLSQAEHGPDSQVILLTPDAAMAQAVAEGANRVNGVDVTIKRVPETMTPEAFAKAGGKQHQQAPVATPQELADYDGIIFGTPTRFGNMAGQMRTFLDQTGGLWASGALYGKVGSVFSSTGTGGGQEHTISSTWTTLAHHGFIIVPIGYATPELFDVSQVRGGTPYGATTIAGADGSRQPSNEELTIARYQGEHVAKITAKLKS